MAIITQPTLERRAHPQMGGLRSGVNLVSRVLRQTQAEAAAANIVADMWQNFEFDTPADLTAWETALNTAASGSATGSATGRVVVAGGNLSISTDGQNAPIAPINSTSVTGTRGLMRAYGTQTNDCGGWRAAADANTCSFGFGFKFTGALGENKVIMLTQNAAGSGGFAISLFSSNKYVGFSGGENNGVALVADTRYWVTVRYIRNSQVTVRVYNAATGAQIGTDAANAVSDHAFREWYYPTFNAQLVDSGTSLYWDNLVYNSSGTFPLGPN